jgi:hypothetical protein
MNQRLLSLLALTLAVGCSPDGPTAPNQPASAALPGLLASAHAPSGGNAGVTPPCQTVRGSITAQLVPGQAAAGTIDGDLQGTITTVLTPDPVGATDQFTTGTVSHLTGYQTVEVAASSIPQLVGRTLVWTLESRSMSPPPIVHTSNTLRITEGATGNLVSHGIIDLTTLTTHFDYEGVICP